MQTWHSYGFSLPSMPPPLPAKADLSLDIILENGTHATNIQGIFQVLLFLEGKNVFLPAFRMLYVGPLMENKC